MVIIIGGTHHNTLSMIRSIGEKGINSDVIIVDHNSDSYILASKYICHAYTCDTDAKALNILLKNYTECDDKPTVIACSDGIASLMDEHYDELKNKFNFCNCGRQGLLTRYMDKHIQVELAKKCGIEVPVSMVLRVGVDNINFNVFPCIVKPLESIHGGKRFNICKSQDELHDALETYEKGDVVLIQQYLKRDYEIVIDGVSFKDNIIIPGYIRKYRDVKGGTDYSSTHPINQIPQSLIDNIRQFVHQIHYEGLFGVEFIVKDNEYYFVEINLRNDATIYSLARAGVNLPYLFVKPKAIESETKNVVREINSMVELRDFRDNVLHRKVGLLQWWKEYKNSECKFYYTQDDPRPLYVARKQLIQSLVRKLIIRK